MKGLTVSLFSAAIALGSQGASALAITPVSDGSVLANVIAGSGLTIDPMSISYTGAADQAGTFTGGGEAGLGIDSGIILTTGEATGALGPNNFTGLSNIVGSGGDPDLQDLGGGTVLDANVLEFDFTSSGGTLSLNYIFASEDYNFFPGPEFTDVLGIFLDGTNLATIGGEPVSFSTVNCGEGGTGVGVNCDRFNNNDFGPADAPFFIEYDGFTDVLTASFSGLSAGTHSLKLAIGDRGDNRFDSAVFVQANSLTVQPDSIPSVPEPGPLALLGLGLVGLGIAQRRR